jgi:diguanylate cyclase (GGDEF)-like protein
VAKKFRIRPFSPILAMVLLFLAVLTFSFYRLVTEADAIDTERTRQAVAAAVQSEIDQVVIMADDNGIWDAAAQAVYAPRIDQQFAWSSWGYTSAESKNYSSVLVLDNKGQTLLAYQKGRTVRRDALLHYGKPLHALLNRLNARKAPVGGLAKTKDGIVLIGVSNILPTSRSLDPLVPAPGPYRLVFVKPFAQEAAEKIGEALQIGGISLAPAETEDTRVTLSDAAGQPIGQFGWVSSHPGTLALKRALPWLVAGVLIHFLFAVLVCKQALGSIQQLMTQAFADSLSGLPNRRSLLKDLRLHLGHKEKVTLALIDLDGFKGINDNYGHNVGDRLIKLIAELLVQKCGKDAVIARLGGDEFAVMVLGAFSIGLVERISQEFLSELSKPFRIDERTVLVGASIGIASCSMGEIDAGELLRRADVAMYAAKEAGKMRMTWFDDQLDQKQAAAHTIEMELRAAIETEDFELLYQPVVSIQDRTIIGVEALLRWNSPTRGAVTPNEFIPVAEATGLIDRIGMIVLRRACRDGMAWPEVSVSVNVSAAQLRNPEFSKELKKVLLDTGFPPERLELEITETYLVLDPATARKVLSEVQALGVTVSLDDFGTGYASIGFLRQFHFKKMKIDRSLVTDAAQSEAARTVLQASVAVARALNMCVAAEGVETDAQADMMRVAGCDQLQGWLFSRAVSPREISSWVVSAKPAQKSGTV